VAALYVVERDYSIARAFRGLVKAVERVCEAH
jgi:hypothetical protein